MIRECAECGADFIVETAGQQYCAECLFWQWSDAHALMGHD